MSKHLRIRRLPERRRLFNPPCKQPSRRRSFEVYEPFRSPSCYAVAQLIFALLLYQVWCPESKYRLVKGREYAVLYFLFVWRSVSSWRCKWYCVVFCNIYFRNKHFETLRSHCPFVQTLSPQAHEKHRRLAPIPRKTLGHLLTKSDEEHWDSLLQHIRVVLGDYC